MRLAPSFVPPARTPKRLLSHDEALPHPQIKASCAHHLPIQRGSLECGTKWCDDSNGARSRALGAYKNGGCWSLRANYYSDLSQTSSSPRVQQRRKTTHDAARYAAWHMQHPTTCSRVCRAHMARTHLRPCRRRRPSSPGQTCGPRGTGRRPGWARSRCRRLRTYRRGRWCRGGRPCRPGSHPLDRCRGRPGGSI